MVPPCHVSGQQCRQLGSATVAQSKQVRLQSSTAAVCVKEQHMHTATPAPNGMLEKLDVTARTDTAWHMTLQDRMRA